MTSVERQAYIDLLKTITGTLMMLAKLKQELEAKLK